MTQTERLSAYHVSLLNEISIARSDALSLRNDSHRAIRRARALEAQGAGAPDVTLAKLFFDHVMEVDLIEEVSRSLYIFGSFEDDLASVFVRNLRPGQTFLDIGAHYGFFALLGARLVGSAGRVVAAEPTPSTAQRLSRNVSDCPNVAIEPSAIWSENTTLEFKTFGTSWSAFNSVSDIRAPPHMATPEPTSVSVNAVSVDWLCQKHRLRPDFIKIDAESAEAHVLSGARDTIETIRPIITLEVGDYPHLVQAGVANSSENLEFLEQRDYALLTPGIWKDEIHERRGPLQYGYQNVICVLKEKLSSYRMEV